MIRLIASLFALCLSFSVLAAPPLPDIPEVECSATETSCVAADLAVSGQGETIHLGARAEHRPAEGDWSPDMRSSLVSLAVVYTTTGGVEVPAIITTDWTEQLQPDETHPYFGKSVCNLIYVNGDGTSDTAHSVPLGAGPGMWQHICTTAKAVDNESMHPVPPVSGYRQLSQAEVELMNEGKAAFNAVGDYLDKLAKYAPKPGETGAGIVTDGRCISIAKTEAQTAAMWAIRSITKPGGFA